MKSPDPGRIKAVAFDVDGTMYANSRMYLRSIGWGLRNWKLIKAFRTVRQDIRDIKPIDDFYGLQAKLTGQAMGISTQQAGKLIRERVYRDWEQTLSGIRLENGLIETLQVFRDMGLGLGVLSDFPVNQKLEILGLNSMFEFALSAEEVGYLKPNPEAFKALANGLGLAPEQILYVGNSYSYDIVGAHSVGMMTAHFAKKPRKHSLANFTFSIYANLRDWVVENL